MASIKRFFIRDKRLHPAWRAFLFLIVYAVVLIIAQASVGVIYWLMRGGFRPEEMAPGAIPLPPYVMAAMGLVGFLAALFVAYIFRRFLDGKSFKSLGFEFREGWIGEIALGFVVGFLLMGSIFLVQWVPGWLILEGVRPLPEILSPLVWTVVFLIPAAAQEELVFRGYFFQNMKEAFGTAAAVVVSSLLFGLFHGANPHVTWLAIVSLVLAGALFACAYLVTGNLWLPIALHFAWNFFEGPVFGFPVSGIRMESLLQVSVGRGIPLITGGAFGPEGGLVGIGANLVGIGLLMFLRRQKPSQEKLQHSPNES